MSLFFLGDMIRNFFRNKKKAKDDKSKVPQTDDKSIHGNFFAQFLSS